MRTEKERIGLLTLENAVEQWLKLRKSQGIARSTIERNQQSMNTIMLVLGESIRLKSITTSHIDGYTRNNVFERIQA